MDVSFLSLLIGFYPYFTFNMNFRKKPIINPGITHNIGNQTDPNNIPKTFVCAEYITPTVTKTVELTKGR